MTIHSGTSGSWPADDQDRSLDEAAVATALDKALRSEDADQIKTLADEALRRDPSCAPARRALGILAFRSNNHDDALQWFMALTEEAPDNPEYWFYIGKVYERAGGMDEAVEACEHALSLNADYGPARSVLSRLAPDRLRRFDVLATADRAAASEQRASISMSRPLGEADQGSFGQALLTALDGTPEHLAAIFPGPLRRVLTRRLASFLAPWSGAVLFAFLTIAGLVTGPGPWTALAGLGFLGCLGYAVQAARVYRVALRDYRVDIEHGVIFRRQTSVWRYHIQSVEYVETPWLALIGTGRIDLTTEVSGQLPRRSRGIMRLRAIGSPRQMRDLADDLRRSSLQQRRILKMNFV
jgi:hypothetical protein